MEIGNESEVNASSNGDGSNGNANDGSKSAGGLTPTDAVDTFLWQPCLGLTGAATAAETHGLCLYATCCKLSCEYAAYFAFDLTSL